MKSRIVLIVLGLCLMIAPAASGKGWSLDRSFSGNGLTTVNLGSAPDGNLKGYSSSSLLRITDAGDIYVVGKGGSKNSRKVIMRFDDSGQYDEEFAAAASKIKAGNFLFAMADDEHIIAAAKDRISRFSLDGSLDSAFGKSGSIQTDGRVTDLVAGTGGKFYAQVDKSTYRNPKVVRFSPRGTELASVAMPGYRDVTGGSYTIQDISPDGKVLTDTWFEDDFGEASSSVYVLDPDHPNRSTEISSLENLEVFIRFRPGGGFLVDEGSGGLSALNARGKRVKDFGTEGVAACQISDEFSGSGGIHDVFFDASGRILATYPPEGCGLTRFSAGGTLDSSFGENGSIRSLHPDAWQVVADPSDRFIATGWDDRKGGPFVSRYDEDGSIDVTFGQDGTTTVPVEISNFDRASDSVLQPDGKLVNAGVSQCADRGCRLLGMSRLRKDGSPDPTFGSGGVVTTELEGLKSIADVELLDGGKLLVAGTAGGPKGQLTHGVVARFRRNGILDRSFGEKGFTVIAPKWSKRSRLAGVAQLNGGRFAAFGDAGCGNDCRDWFVAAFDGTGTPDPGFGNEGQVRLDVGTRDQDGGDVDAADSITAVPGSRIALVGRSRSRKFYKPIAVVRLRDDGTRDPNFGTAGRGFFSVYEFWIDGAGKRFRIEMQTNPQDVQPGPRGSLYIASGAEVSGGGYKSNNKGSILRVNRAGRIDRHFGFGRGFIENNRMTATGLEVDRCGRLVVGGTSLERKNRYDFAFTRYSPSGKVDRAFGRRPVPIAIGGKRMSHATSIATSGNRVLLSGTATTRAGDDDFAVAAVKLKKSGRRCP